jgi:ribonuclease BN (tRNA processing enzyme)
VRMTVLGGCGAWPVPDQARSGYLIEHDEFHVLVDPGYATLPRLLEYIAARDVDAVLVTHGHPDHCANLSPLLRARALAPDPPVRLPVFALPGAVDAVLAMDARLLARTRQAEQAGVARLVLTHLWPGTDPLSARDAAGSVFPRSVEVARENLVIDIDARR